MITKEVIIFNNQELFPLIYMTTPQERYYDNHLNEERSKAKERYYKNQDTIAERGYQRVMCTICDKEISRNGRYCHNKTKQHQVNLKEDIISIIKEVGKICKEDVKNSG